MSVHWVITALQSAFIPQATKFSCSKAIILMLFLHAVCPLQDVALFTASPKDSWLVTSPLPHAPACPTCLHCPASIYTLIALCLSFQGTSPPLLFFPLTLCHLTCPKYLNFKDHNAIYEPVFSNFRSHNILAFITFQVQSILGTFL